MKAYKIKVTATISMTLTEKEYSNECEMEGSVPGEFNEFSASMFAKATLIERMRNNPNCGSVRIEEIEI